MPLLAPVTTAEVAGARWHFERLDIETRAALPPLHVPGDVPQSTRNLFAAVARSCTGVDGLADHEGAPVAWPADEPGRLAVLGALAWRDFDALAAHYVRAVYGIGEALAGN